MAGIAVLRHARRFARPVIWVFIVVTVVDLGNAALGGLREGAFETATDVSWLILTFYVPLLWITTALVAWLVTTRSREIVEG